MYYKDQGQTLARGHVTILREHPSCIHGILSNIQQVYRFSIRVLILAISQTGLTSHGNKINPDFSLIKPLNPNI